MFSAQELLSKHGITFVATKKSSYQTNCPSCRQGYLTVKIDNKGVQWFCHDCEEGGGEYYEQRKANGHDRDEPSRVYPYVDENGKRLYESLRFEPIGKPKYFRQRIGPDQKKWSIKGVRLVPYHLPQLIAAAADDRIVFVVEGEKDVETLERHGIAATCCAMGAGKWKPLYDKYFDDVDIVICGDNDAPGRRHVRQVARHLVPTARCVRILDLKSVWPEIQESDDISDWFERSGKGAPELLEIIGTLSPLDETFASSDDADTDDEAPSSAKATRYVAPDPVSIPKRSWLYGGHYIRQTTSATVAPGGFGKTTLQLFEALEMVRAGLRVWYLSGEDPLVELDRRIAAHCEQHSITSLDELPGQLFVDDRSSFPLSIAKARNGVISFDEESLLSFEQAITADKIDAVIIDPFVSFHTVPENDNNNVDAIIKRLAAIATRVNCAIEISHHVRKGPSTGGFRVELTVDDARGGSAIINAVRSGRVINRMSTTEAEQAKVEPNKKNFYVRVDIGKRNMAPPPDKATWFQLTGKTIANGDYVQALVPWIFPGLMDELSVEDTEHIRELVRQRNFRADPRSPDWLGIEVAKRMKLNPELVADIKKIQKIIGVWLRNGVFAKAELRDEDRKKRIFYVKPEPRPSEPQPLPDNVMQLYPDDNGDG